jgi:hypothetical protein
MQRNEKDKEHPLLAWMRTSPLIKTLVVIIPMTWHGIVISFFGKKIGFLDAEGFTSRGIIVTITVYSFVALYTLIINTFNRIRIKQEADYADIAQFVLDRVKFLYNEKLDNQKDTFFNQNLTTPFSYDVVKRVRIVLRELIRCIEYSSDIEEDNISAALFYSFVDKEGENWRLAEVNYCHAFDVEYEDDDVDEDKRPLLEKEKEERKIRDAVMHPESFAVFLKKYNAGNFYLLKNKYRDGKKLSTYKMNDRDREMYRKTKRYGSIAGWKFTIKHNDIIYIRAMLFISTYGIPLKKSRVGGNWNTVEKNLKKLILPYFQMNFQAELMHLHREK